MAVQCIAYPLYSATEQQLVTTAISPVLSKLSQHYNTTIFYGLRSSNSAVSLASGRESRYSERQVDPDALIPMGSVTKSFTATAVAQLVERGLIKSWDEPAYKHVDPVLSRLNGTTMLELWNGDSTIQSVTIRQLATMRAGLNDYDDEAMQEWTYSHPNQDITPLDYLHTVNKTFMFIPGTGGAYSSIGFELLGFVLVSHLTDQGDWKDYDQLSVIPESLRAQFNHTTFPSGGPCSSYDSVIHQYHLAYDRAQKGLVFNDLIEDSCLNGWTFGNIAASALDVASFYYHLLRPGSTIVSTETQAIMMQMQHLTTGWSSGLPYGYGLMTEGFRLNKGNYSIAGLIGHGGEDWGSGSPQPGYNPVLDFGVAVGLGSSAGMNCSIGDGLGFLDRGDVSANLQAQQVISCKLYQATLDVMAPLRGLEAPELDCEVKARKLHVTCAEPTTKMEPSENDLQLALARLQRP
jgi:CubicO group peptidase (beta-lactamase class C family)